MSKNTFFTGQPVLTQILSFVNKDSIKRISITGSYDRYYKSFDTYSHLITMLYCMLNKCTSSREVVSGMKACHNKLAHLGVRKAPGKSTLCDANKKRSFEAFAQIYDSLYNSHKRLLPDSRHYLRSKLFIADSSTITLFQEILKAPSMGKMNGKRKGGIKVHTLIDSGNDVPVKINFSSARDNDVTFLKDINLDSGAFIVFDKGYVDYSQYERMSKDGVFFVTRQRKGSSFKEIEKYNVHEKSKSKGVLSDSIIILGTRTHAKKLNLKLDLFHSMIKKNKESSSF